MKLLRSPWVIVAFLVGFLAVGLPYWQIPYAKANLPNSLIGPGLIVIVAAAAICRAGGKTPILKTILVVGAAVPAAVVARVLVEAIKDPTSHNLWPLEAVIALVLGLSTSAIGTLLGSVPLLLLGKDSKDSYDGR